MKQVAMCWARVWIALLAATVVSIAAADAQTPRVRLRIRPANVTFASADPDVSPIVTAPPTEAAIRVHRNANNPWQLTVLAGGDLIDGAAVIPIGAVSWTATPSPPFQSGILSATVAQLVAGGTGNVNRRIFGSILFNMVNSWKYAVGTYTQVFTFTLSAP